MAPGACLGILRRAFERGKALPKKLERALKIQAGLALPDGQITDIDAYHINQRDEGIDLQGVSGALMATSNMQMQTFVTQASENTEGFDGYNGDLTGDVAATLGVNCGMSTGRNGVIAFAANQRDEVRDLHDVAGALNAQPGIKQQTFVAGFSAGAGASAGSIGYHESVAPTLKASASGNSMPSVLCINDQGGQVMEISEGMTGTLRAQEHGHQPLVYTRVSSDSEDQLNSFAAQNRYYTELISSKAEWRMVDIYADEGITGTSVTKRDDFQRMMADCRRGLIDQILVKSISRFARNTIDCLQNIRELKELGVNVRFEREGIDTVNVSSELITAIYAAFAQKESESISGNRQWGYQRSMEQGTFNTYYAPVGFTLIDGNLQINQAEAPTIQRIFTEYLSGNNSREIAAALNKDKALGRHWRREAIDYILQNERYAGNALLQKRYTTDSFPRKKKRNRGEREMYFVSGSNEAIISQEMFDQAQQLRKTRKREPMPLHDTISRQIRCSCGARVRAKKINQKWYWC